MLFYFGHVLESQESRKHFLQSLSKYLWKWDEAENTFKGNERRSWIQIPWASKPSRITDFALQKKTFSILDTYKWSALEKI